MVVEEWDAEQVPDAGTVGERASAAHTEHTGAGGLERVVEAIRAVVRVLQERRLDLSLRTQCRTITIATVTNIICSLVKYSRRELRVRVFC